MLISRFDVCPNWAMVLIKAIINNLDNETDPKGSKATYRITYISFTHVHIMYASKELIFSH